MKYRKQPGQANRPPMKPEKRDQMVEESRAKLVVRFHNNAKSMSFWSKCGQRKHRNINDAINYLISMLSCDAWRGCVDSAAIFDTRETKETSAENKIYQYENGVLKLEKPITW